jgi:hypothetical protein
MTITQINTATQPSVIAPKPKNALVHGVYATDHTLPWESADDLEHLHQELRKEWDPQGATEEETVLSLCRYMWLKRRVMRSAQFAARKDPFVVELEKAGAKNWDDVESFLQKKAAADDGVIAKVHSTLDQLKTAAEEASSLMTVKDKDTQTIYQSVMNVKSLFEKTVVPVYGEVYKKRPDTNNPVEDSYHPDFLEKIVRLDASLDARIDKMLNRLVSTKEFKRLNQATQPKSVANSSIAPPVLEAKKNKS